MHRVHSFPIRWISLCLLTVWLVAPASALAQPAGDANQQVVRVTVVDQATLELLRSLEATGDDLELWSEVFQIGPVDLRASPLGLASLRAAGLRYEVLIEDFQAYLDEVFGGDRGGDFFDRLRTYDEHVQFLRDLVATYPDLAQMIEVGKSVEGRSLWALRVTGKGKVKPAVFYHGAEHGGEQAGSSVVAYMARHLLSNYKTDPNVAALVDHAEWYLLPIMNPDGYVRGQRYNVHGVDLNRNWDGPGAGQDPRGGPYPFSEPETRALRDLLVGHSTIRVHVDVHGYAPMIMWPWGHKPDPCPHHARFLGLGTVMRDRVANSGGGTYQIGVIYTTLYKISGGSSDYSYGVRGLWAFLIELAHAQMPGICQQVLTGMLYLGEWIWTIDCNGNGVDDPEDIAKGTSRDRNHNNIPDECEPLADLNCDGERNNFDIDPFVLALTDPAGYKQKHPDCDILRGDINGDGVVDNFDIDLFVELLTGP